MKLYKANIKSAIAVIRQVESSFQLF